MDNFLQNSQASKPEHVARQILDRIVNERLAKGDSLGTEAELLAQYPVSRPTLRESLRILEAQGVLSLRPGPKGGVIVSKPGTDILAHGLSVYLRMHDVPLSEALRAREVMEPGLAENAAENASASDIAAMEESVERMRAMKNEEEFAEENRLFHGLVAAACGNQVMEIFWSCVNAIIASEYRTMRFTAPKREAIVAAHEALISACRNKDGAAASTAMRNHVRDFESLRPAGTRRRNSA